MDATAVSGLLMIAGSIVFGVGAAVAVPRVFMTPDADARLRMLQENAARWRAMQPWYGLGPVIAALGVVSLAAGVTEPAARTVLAASGAALAVGALAWCRSCYLRGRRIADFVYGRLPGWPFTSYVLLTIGGLAGLGAGLLLAGFPAWLGWLTVGAAGSFLAAYAWFKDIPPFVFYVLLLLVGALVI